MRPRGNLSWITHSSHIGLTIKKRVLQKIYHCPRRIVWTDCELAELETWVQAALFHQRKVPVQRKYPRDGRPKIPAGALVLM